METLKLHLFKGSFAALKKKTLLLSDFLSVSLSLADPFEPQFLAKRLICDLLPSTFHALHEN